MVLMSFQCDNESEKAIPETNIEKLDIKNHRFPCSIVWTPLPLITWIFPFIGHMGIASCSGIIRDFAGPYFVSEDNMAFGWPTKYWPLNPYRTSGGTHCWDKSITLASEEYKTRMHNLFCDNCHSHVAMALNSMEYEGKTSWNMVKLCFLLMLHGRYTSFGGIVKTWLPFCIILTCIILFLIFM